LPTVDKYKPEYYSLDTSSCGRDISASVLTDERQIRYIASKSLISSSYMELNNEEALAKTPWVFFATARWPCMESPRAFSCKGSTNAVLKRRDVVIV
jgi:hypothetical protein